MVFLPDPHLPVAPADRHFSFGNFSLEKPRQERLETVRLGGGDLRARLRRPRLQPVPVRRHGPAHDLGGRGASERAQVRARRGAAGAAVPGRLHGVRLPRVSRQGALRALRVGNEKGPFGPFSFRLDFFLRRRAESAPRSSRAPRPCRRSSPRRRAAPRPTPPPPPCPPYPPPHPPSRLPRSPRPIPR